MFQKLAFSQRVLRSLSGEKTAGFFQRAGMATKKGLGAVGRGTKGLATTGLLLGGAATAAGLYGAFGPKARQYQHGFAPGHAEMEIE